VRDHKAQAAVPYSPVRSEFARLLVRAHSHPA
jgi:hypothetical protein